MSYRLHRAGERLDYTVDWSALLAGDTVSSVAWSLTPALPGQVLESSGSGFDRTCMVSGLTAGLIYELTCVATSGQGRTPIRSFTLRCPKE